MQPCGVTLPVTPQSVSCFIARDGSGSPICTNTITGSAVIIPNSSGFTPNASNNIGVDTTAKAMKYYDGAAAKTVVDKGQVYSECTVIKSPDATSNYHTLFRKPYATTVVGFHGIQAGGTNVVGAWDSCDANAGLCHAIASDITITTSNVDNGTLNGYATISANTYAGWHTTSTSPSNGVSWVSVCIDYKIN
jgi:hypothetical protein